MGGNGNGSGNSSHTNKLGQSFHPLNPSEDVGIGAEINLAIGGEGNVGENSNVGDGGTVEL